MDDHEALEQLRVDILDVLPPGPQRDVWLAWLAELLADSLWRSDVAFAPIELRLREIS
jgi:hypothetical protein